MPRTPEAGPQMIEQKKGEPFIRINMDMATPEDYKKLEELGWTKGTAHPHGGEMDFFWEKEGEPELPSALAEKARGGIEYTQPIKKEAE
jgi:hypothetical protein